MRIAQRVVTHKHAQFLDGSMELKRVGLESTSSTSRTSSSMLSKNLFSSHLGCHPILYAFTGAIVALELAVRHDHQVHHSDGDGKEEGICIPGGAHGPDVQPRKSKSVSGLIVAGPRLDLGRVHEATRIHGLGDALRDGPPRGLVGHGKVVALLAAGDGLLEQDLLHEQGIQLGQVGDVRCGGRLGIKKH